MKNDFLDEVKIHVKGGDGGAGSLAFRRAKYEPLGGPSGGDGGAGGNVYLEADESLYTLNDFLYKVHFKADRGLHGKGDRKDGKRGDDLTVKVPCGTQVFDSDSGDLLADLTNQGDQLLAVRGGHGGYGNAHYASGLHRAPQFADKGEPGHERWLKLVLKMVADVGLVGFPNAGKSTLLSKITSATPAIAAYPFTTLSPVLGVATLPHEERCVVADIPGLIEGAHQGVGLGHKFLRHIERTRILVHLVDITQVDAEDPVAAYRAVREELRLYNPDLVDRPEILVLNKIDGMNEAGVERIRKAYEAAGLTPLLISAEQGRGLGPLLQRMEDELLKIRAQPVVIEAPPAPVKKPKFVVERRKRGRFRVSGDEVERLLVMTDMENDAAVRHLQLRFKKMGLDDELKKQGAKPGDTVAILGWEFEYQES